MPDPSIEAAQSSAIRLLRLAMLAAFVLPLILFAFAAAMNFRHIETVVDERITRTLGILHEHTLKVFETIERSIAETNEVIRGLSDAEIVADQERLHHRLRELVQAMPQLKSLWVFDRNGRALVNTLAYPPPDVAFADRDYFRAHVEKDAGIFVGEVLRPRDPYPEGDFFSVSRRRRSEDGSFRGVIQVSLLPSYFEQFYRKLEESLPGGYLALVREDGTILTRYPAAAARNGGPLAAAMRENPRGGFVTQMAGADGVERRLSWQKLANLPIMVVAGVETSAIRAEWLSAMSGYLVFGIPATIVLLGVMGIALERTRRLYVEQSRRVAAEVALRQAQRMEAIGQLTGGVAHDFNNILMIIKGSAYRLRRELPDAKNLHRLDMIETAAQRGENLTRQLLAFSRRQSLSPSVIDLCARVREFRSLLAPSLRGDIEIGIDVPASVVAARVDVSELELAVLNLAVNARDAMPDGGRIEIAVRPVRLHGEAALDRLQGDFIALSVSDNGCGIAPDILNRIFEPFFTTKDVGKGTGLGLSQVYGFAKQSGGTVTVASKLGRGTTFTLYLPRSREAPEPPVPAAAGPERSCESGCVLVVEDSGEVADIAAGLLTELGFRVICAPNAPAALERLRSGQRVDLVFSDVVMPGGMSGVEFAQVVRAEFPRLPVVLTTGYYHAVDKPLPSGVPVLRKPYDVAELKKTLRSVLRERGDGARAAG